MTETELKQRVDILEGQLRFLYNLGEFKAGVIRGLEIADGLSGAGSPMRSPRFREQGVR